MKRKTLCKVLYILAALLLVGCGICLGVDYHRYSTTLNSAPFTVWVLVRVIEFCLPAQIVFLIAYLLERKDKK